MPRKSKKTSQEKRTYAWLLLFDSRHARPPEKEPIGTGERGRPRLNVATYQTSMTLAKGDREALDAWQERLSELLGRKASLGETVGFLARICAERLASVNEGGTPVQPESLQDLVQLFVTGEVEE